MRYISSFCQAAEGMFNCLCYGLEEVPLVAMNAIDEMDEELDPMSLNTITEGNGVLFAMMVNPTLA